MVVVAEEAVVVSVVVVVVVVATTAVLVVTGTAELAAGRLEDAITEMQQQTSSIQSTAAARESSKNLTTHHESQKQSDDYKTQRQTHTHTEARCKRLQIAHVNQCRTKSTEADADLLSPTAKGGDYDAIARISSRNARTTRRSTDNRSRASCCCCCCSCVVSSGAVCVQQQIHESKFFLKMENAQFAKLRKIIFFESSGRGGEEQATKENTKARSSDSIASLVSDSLLSLSLSRARACCCNKTTTLRAFSRHSRS
jgi:hypothetical protein